VRDTGPRRHIFDSIPVQALIALSFNNLSLFAGGLISIFTPRFQAAPWILALFPPVLTIRGGIGGIFSGNLATMLHLGLVKPRIRGNTEAYVQLIRASFVITVIDTLAMGLFAFVINFLLGDATLSQFLFFLVLPPVTCVMALALSIPLTSVIAIATFRRGLDPDIVVYPILASINDIVVTAAFVASVFLVLAGGSFHALLALIFLAIMGVAGYLAYRNREVKFFHQTIREGTTVVIFSSLFGSINGLFLSRMSQNLMRHPGLVVLYPALTNALGNIGSIIGSTKTTSLALGYSRSFVEDLKDNIETILGIEAVALMMHLIFGLVTFLIAKPIMAGARVSTLLGVAVISNLFTFLPIAVFAIGIAHLAFRRGLNPDNVVIPVITSVSDSVATLGVIPSLMILSLLGIV